MSTVPDVGVWRNLLCTTNGILVDAGGKCICLSTQRVPGEDERCREVTFVHRMGVFCGCRRKNAAACPLHSS